MGRTFYQGPGFELCGSEAEARQSFREAGVPAPAVIETIGGRRSRPASISSPLAGRIAEQVGQEVGRALAGITPVAPAPSAELPAPPGAPYDDVAWQARQQAKSRMLGEAFVGRLSPLRESRTPAPKSIEQQLREGLGSATGEPLRVVVTTPEQDADYRWAHRAERWEQAARELLGVEQ